MVSAELAEKLAGPMAPGQYAQLQQGDPQSLTVQALGEPIGVVTELEGSVTVTRANASQVTLSAGDSIYQGDALETGADSTVGVVFADDTTFSLDADGSMVLDEMVYDPDTQTGAFEATVIKGVFSFVSGQVAKTADDAMVINTPKATIGIRGSTGLVKAGVDGGEDKITLIPDIDGTLGELFVSNSGGFQVLNQANASTTVVSAFESPASVVFLSPQEIQQDYGKTLTTLVKTEAKKAVAKAEQTARQSDEAEQAAAQQQEEAQQAEDAAAAEALAAADAEADALAAEVEAATAAEAAAQAQAEAEVLAAAAELSATAEAQAAAEEAQAAAEALAAEAQTAEAAAQA
ncbi:MAG: FecR domain-containing protein, partial [Magnetovibrio sp.]|nr:FecR domain-containing protein [Magnetovibrio sp.]